MEKVQQVLPSNTVACACVLDVCKDLQSKFSALDVMQRFNKQFSGAFEKAERPDVSDILEAFSRRGYVRYGGVGRDGFTLYIYIEGASVPGIQLSQPILDRIHDYVMGKSASRRFLTPDRVAAALKLPRDLVTKGLSYMWSIGVLEKIEDEMRFRAYID